MLKGELCRIPLVDVVVVDIVGHISRGCNLEHNVMFRCKSIDSFHHKRGKKVGIGDILN